MAFAIEWMGGSRNGMGQWKGIVKGSRKITELWDLAPRIKSYGSSKSGWWAEQRMEHSKGMGG